MIAAALQCFLNEIHHSQFPSSGSSLPAYFPDPWANSHNVMYDGKAWPQFFDSGCVRIDNANPRAVTIGSITVDLPGTECSDYGCRPVHFDRWPRNKVIPPGCKWIITEMEGIPDLFPPAPFPNAVAVTVTATDADGHPINGVVFAVFAGDTHVGSAITFGNGSATVNFVPTAAGTYSLSAICDGVKSAPIILTVVLPAAVYTAASITAIAAGSSGELYIRWAGLPNPGLCGSNNGWVMIPPNAPQAMKSLAVSLYYNGKPVRIDTAGCVGAYERVTALYSPGG